jgi:hypothetical protein
MNGCTTTTTIPLWITNHPAYLPQGLNPNARNRKKGIVPMLCQDCGKRSECTFLCERAERYVDKDSVSLREILHQAVHMDPSPLHDLILPEDIASYFTDGKPDFPFLTPLQNKILYMFHFQGLPYSQIAIRTSGNHRGKHSRKAIKSQLARARAKIRNFFYKCRDYL